MDTVDTLSRRRQWLLLLTACGFLVWQLPQVAGRLVDPGFALATRISGLLLFAAGLVGVLLWTRTVHKSGAGAAVEDEMTRHNRLVAFNTGFWAMLVLAALLLAAAQFMPLRGADAAHLVLIAGVVAPLLRFAFLEGLGERG